MSKKIDVKKIVNAPYNPRYMSQEASQGLSESMDSYGEISGIVINSRTGNVVGGNHRYNNLLAKHGGKNNIELEHIAEDRYMMVEKASGISTGFIVRLVDWDEQKEKEANIMANSEFIQGEFTSSLQGLIDSIKVNIPSMKIKKMRIDAMSISSLEDDIFDNKEYEDDNNLTADKTKKREKTLERLSTDDYNEDIDMSVHNGPVIDVIGNIKIVAPSDILDEVKNDIIDALENKKYYSKIKIIQGM